MDSRASHGLTVDFNNLSLHSDYDGPDDTMIDDGIELPITHIGYTTFSFSFKSSVLDNVLCVLSMKNNLLSVFKLFHSNNVSIKFLTFSLVVKDLRTGAPLVERPNKDEWPTHASFTPNQFLPLLVSKSDYKNGATDLAIIPAKSLSILFLLIVYRCHLL